MIRIGKYIINEAAIAYINFNATRTDLDCRPIQGVRIHFLAPNHIDYSSGNCGTITDSLFFTGIEAEGIREYYNVQRSILDLTNLAK